MRRSGDAVVVKVGDPAAREVVVLARWEQDIEDLAATAGTEFLVGGRSTSRNRTGTWWRDWWSQPVIRPSRQLVCGRRGSCGTSSTVRECGAVPGGRPSGTGGAVGTRPPRSSDVGRQNAGHASWGTLMTRPPLDTTGGRPTSGAEFTIARQLVFGQELSPHCHRPSMPMSDGPGT